MLKQQFVKQHFCPLTQTVDVEDPVWKAWRAMKDNDVKRLPVLKNQKVVGVVSDRDIVQISGYNGGQSMPVKEAMSLNPLIINIEINLYEALRSMLDKDQQHAVVVDDDNQVCGLFSWASAFEIILEITDMAKINQLLSS